MKRMLMAILAVAVAISFSAPAFADEGGKKEKKGKKDGQVLVYSDEEKKDEKGGNVVVFGEEGDKKKKGEKGK